MRQIVSSGNSSYLIYSTLKGGIAGRRYRKKKKSTSISVEVIKGHRVIVKHAFLLFPRRGGVGIFKRKGKSRYPIERLYGPSPRGMAKTVGVDKILEKVVNTEGNKILERSLKRYLRKW